MTAIHLGLMARNPIHGLEQNVTDFQVDDIDTRVLIPENPLGPAKKATDTALLVVSAYIPAEALGFYLTATALLEYPKGWTDAGIAVVTLGFVALLVLAPNVQSQDAVRSGWRLTLALLFALTAACAYIAALPQSFVHQWPPYTSSVGAVVVIGCSILLPALGTITKFNPPMRQR